MKCDNVILTTRISKIFQLLSISLKLHHRLVVVANMAKVNKKRWGLEVNVYKQYAYLDSSLSSSVLLY